MLNNKDALQLVKKTTRNFENKTFIVVLVVVFLIIIIPFTYYKSIKMIAEEQKIYYYEGKMIRLNPGMTDEQYSKIENLASEKDYVVRVDKVYTRALESEIKSGFGKKSGYVELAPTLPYNSPDEELINYGRQIQNDGEMICPSTMFFGAFDDVNLNKGLKTKDYIDQDVKLNLYIYDKDSTLNNMKFLEKTFKLVGTYDASKPYSYATCYISEKAFYKNVDETILFRSDSPSGAIYIKNYADRKKVGEILKQEKIGYQEENLDYSFLNTTLFISLMTSVLLVLFSTFVLHLYIKKYVKGNYKTLTLYKALGFNKKSIVKILFLEVLSLWLKAFVLSIVFSVVGSKLLELYLSRITSYETLQIRLSYISVISYFFLVIFIAYQIIKTESHFIDNFSVKELESKM